jgi:hypothetical protein
MGQSFFVPRNCSYKVAYRYLAAPSLCSTHTHRVTDIPQMISLRVCYTHINTKRHLGRKCERSEFMNRPQMRAFLRHCYSLPSSYKHGRICGQHHGSKYRNCYISLRSQIRASRAPQSSSCVIDPCRQHASFCIVVTYGPGVPSTAA